MTTNETGGIVGYIRVSTKAQADKGTSLDTQREHVMEHGATRVFEDAMSGTKATRPGYQEMLKYVRPGDVVVVSYLSRLGRNARELRRAADELRDMNVHIVALKEGADTRTAAGRMLFGFLSVLAEYEHEQIMERTEAGREKAAQLGRRGGRPPKYDRELIARAHQLHEQPNLTAKDKAAVLGCSVATFYRLLQSTPNQAA